MLESHREGHASVADSLTDAQKNPASAPYFHTVFDSVDQIDAEAWDALRGNGDALFMDRRLLSAVERSMPGETRCWYVLFRDADGQPVCTAVLSSHILDATSLDESFSTTLARWASVAVPTLRKLKVIYLGMPFSAGQNHLRFASGVDRSAIVPVLDRILCAEAREFGAKCIIAKEFGAADVDGMSPFLDCGYRRADSLPMNYMRVEHGSYADFCARNRKLRQNLRSSSRKFWAGGLRFETFRGNEAAERMTDDVHRLYLAVVERSPIKLERLPAVFFREVCRQLPDNAEILYVYHGDRVVAFTLDLFSDRMFWALYLGLDYERNREYALYFNVMCEAANRGMKRGAETIMLGQTADDAKYIRFHSYQEPLSLYVKGTSITARAAMRFSFSALFPSYPVSYPRPTTSA